MPLSGEHGLEQLLGGLLAVEADDLVGSGVDRLEGPDGGEIGVRARAACGRARPQADS